MNNIKQFCHKSYCTKFRYTSEDKLNHWFCDEHNHIKHCPNCKSSCISSYNGMTRYSKCGFTNYRNLKDIPKNI